MDEDQKLHIVTFPWLAFGHIIPYLELSKCVAKRSHHISFTSTPHNIERLPPIPQSLSPTINLVKLNPPTIHGVPPNAQATLDVPIDQAHLIKKLMDGLEGPLCSFLDQQDPPPDWIIYDLLHHLVPRLVRRFDLPSAYFSVMSGLTHSFLGPPSVLLVPRDQTPFTPELLLEVPPWVPFPTS